jgi:hypothetical protein
MIGGVQRLLHQRVDVDRLPITVVAHADLEHVGEIARRHL